jgi:DNA polymerase III delta prime subunit
VTALSFDVIGAAGPKQYFARQTRETLAHAYLFSGPPGIGKKTFARRLAQSLLCEAPKTGVLGYDGTCPSCRIFAAGDETRHPDFLEHIGTLRIGDRDAATGFYESEDLSARDLVRQLSMQSYSGGARLLLLGDVDFATHHAANALLKFFEEPPSGVVMILTTPSPGRLLETIRSRLIELRFPLLSRQNVREILLELGYDAERAELGASLAHGSVSHAIAALGSGDESLRAAVAAWFFEVVAGVTPEETWATRETLDEGLEFLKSLVRDWLALSTASQNVPLAAPDYARTLTTLPPLDRSGAVATLVKFDEAQRLARTNVSPTMVSELIRMSLTSRARVS